MISRLSHASIFVKDQDEALKFYTEKLGFELRHDVTMEGFRWLTVGTKEQDGLEIVLMAVAPGGVLDEESANAITTLMDKGVFGAGVFHTHDCQATYETLKARGVEFRQAPTERPYGIEALFSDNSGNWFSLTQPRG